MTLSHQKAFEYTIQASEGRLDPNAQLELTRHLEICQECKANAELYTGLRGENSPAQNLPSIPIANRNLIQIVLRKRSLEKVGWNRFVGFARSATSIAIGIFLVVVLAWGIENLRTGGRSPSSVGTGSPTFFAPPLFQFLQGSPYGSITWPNSNDIAQWLFSHSILIVLIPMLFLSGVGFYFGFQLSKKFADWGWLLFLMGLFFLELILEAASMAVRGVALVIFIFPLVAATWMALIIHIWSTPEFYSTRFFLLIGFYFAGLFAFQLGPWWSKDLWSSQLIILISALVAAVLWQSFEWRPQWRWLSGLLLFFGLAICVFGLLIYRVDPDQPRNAWYYSFNSLGSLVGILTILILASRLVIGFLSESQPFQNRRLILYLITMIGLFGLGFVTIWTMAIEDKVSEEGLSAGLTIFFAEIGLVAGLVGAAWKLSGWRRWIGLLLIVTFFAGLIPAAAGPKASAEQLTRQRAAEINQAVLRFYHDKGRYPSNIIELEPWYLVRIPEAITWGDRVWCHEGGKDYYRLGYYEFTDFPYFIGHVTAKQFASAGPLPIQPWRCEVSFQEYFSQTRR
jgi:hypothetical protein